MSEIGSLGLQKLAIATSVGFSNVLFPSLALLIIMVVIVIVATAIQE
jgi:hypothetical protein